MIKTIVLCNSDLLAFPAIFRLLETGSLQAVAIPEMASKVLMPAFVGMGIPAYDIHVLSRKDLESQLALLIDQYCPEAVLVLTFPWKIPEGVLQLPAMGFINFHFGLLPLYKGADPVFWQLKKGEAQGGISVHVMTDEIDEGPVFVLKSLPVIPEETYGIHCQRLGVLAAETITEVFKFMSMSVIPLSLPIDKAVFYCKSPSITDLTIRWEEQTAEEIERLINATNPKYGGAIASIRNIQVRILEVSAAQVSTQVEQRPGTIVYADTLYGIIVSCINGQYLKINIVNIAEGYLSGGKLFNLGFKVGEIFT